MKKKRAVPKQRNPIVGSAILRKGAVHQKSHKAQRRLERVAVVFRAMRGDHPGAGASGLSMIPVRISALILSFILRVFAPRSA